MTDISILERLKQFNTLFTDPYAVHHWHSKRARNAWSELEGWQDAMAGPLYHFLYSGDCQYMYARPNIIADINTPEDLQFYLLESLDHLATGVHNFVPRNQSEKQDYQYMCWIINTIPDLIQYVYEQEKARWDQQHLKNMQ